MTIDKYMIALEAARNDGNMSLVHQLLVQASELGDPRAKYALATWLLFGNDIVERNEIAGVVQLNKLKDSNISEVLFDIAVSYDLGKSVRKNRKLAAFYYMEAALLGDRESCRQVAEFFREGRFFPKSERLYRAWMQRSECEAKDISPPYRLSLESR